MEKLTLQERAYEYKIKTGYNIASQDVCKKIADDLISALSILQDQDNKSLMEMHKHFRKGE